MELISLSFAKRCRQCRKRISDAEAAAYSSQQCETCWSLRFKPTTRRKRTRRGHLPSFTQARYSDHRRKILSFQEE